MIRQDAATIPHAAPGRVSTHGRGRGALALVKTTFQRFFAARADMLSGSIAFFTVLSLAPLLVFAVAIAGVVFGEEAARQQVVSDLSASMGPNAAGVLDQLLAAAARGGHGWKVGLGLVVGLWGASRIFVRIQDALNDVWSVRAKHTRDLGDKAKRLFRKRAGSFFIAMAVGLLLFASMAVKAVLAGAHELTGELPFGIRALPIIEAVASILLIALFIGIVFWRLPDVELRYRDVLPGAIVTSLLAAVGAYAISAYLGYFATTSVSGAVGGVFVLLLWIYFNAQVFLFGAEFTRAWTEWRRGEVAPQPHAEYVPMREDSTRITDAKRR